MAHMVVFAFKLETAMKARVEMEALRRRITQGHLLREALATYLKEHSGDELSTRRREREVSKARPVDMHDGVMFMATVRDIIAKQKQIIKGWRKLEVRDYDHFLTQVESENAVAETYEHSDWILQELERLEQELTREKQELQDAQS